MSNPYYGVFFQDTWRAASNLTLNFGLRYEFEDGIKESEDRWLTEFDPDARLAITDMAQAAYARNPIPQVPVSDFRVLGGSVYAGAPGRDGLELEGRIDVDAARLGRLHARRADRASRAATACSSTR